jgi:hypothetical protein
MGAHGGNRVELSIDDPGRLIDFVHDLMNDQQVRTDYESNPAAVLARYGVHLRGPVPNVTAPPADRLQVVHASLTASADVMSTCFSFGG